MKQASLRISHERWALFSVILSDNPRAAVGSFLPHTHRTHSLENIWGSLCEHSEVLSVAHVRDPFSALLSFGLQPQLLNSELEGSEFSLHVL